MTIIKLRKKYRVPKYSKRGASNKGGQSHPKVKRPPTGPPGTPRGKKLGAGRSK